MVSLSAVEQKKKRGSGRGAPAEEPRCLYGDETGPRVTALTRFERLVARLPSDAVGVLLAAQEAVLGLTQGAAGDISSTAPPSHTKAMRSPSATRFRNPAPPPPATIPVPKLVT